MHMNLAVYDSADKGQKAMMTWDTTRANATLLVDSCEVKTIGWFGRHIEPGIRVVSRPCPWRPRGRRTCRKLR